MIKYPLKTEILLLTRGSDLRCKINFVGKDTFKLEDIYKRIYKEDGSFIEFFLSNEIILDRSSVIGYTYISNIIKQEIYNKTPKLSIKDNLIIIDFKRSKNG